MEVGAMQRKLSGWAVQDKTRRFYDLYPLLYDRDGLRLAHAAVAQNAGSATAGCDGITMARFDEALEAHLQHLAQDLKSETLQPSPVRRVHIPKPNGKVRPLGIPTGYTSCTSFNKQSGAQGRPCGGGAGGCGCPTPPGCPG